jgi:hypothetical protein
LTGPQTWSPPSQLSHAAQWLGATSTVPLPLSNTPDTFVITYTQGGANTVIVQSHTGIAWPDDVKNKYKNLKNATEKNTKQWLDVEDGIFFFE